MAGWVENSWLTSEVGPGTHNVVLAAGNIPAKALVKYSAAKIAACGVDDVDVAGVSLETSAKILNQEVAVVFSGPAVAVADVGITAGESLKCAPSGKVAPALTSTKAAVTIEDNVGLGFANQPANDGIEIGSSSALDTMPVDIWGTTDGGVTVVRERVTLTGTTFVSSVKTDWGVILGWEIPLGYPTAAGTITLREASGNATIITMASGTRQKGVVTVPLANRRAFNHVISVVADAGTTKTVGVLGTTVDGVLQKKAVVLTGATKVNFADEFQTVLQIFVGDLEVARTATFKTDTVLDGPAKIVGTALETVLAAADVEFNFFKPERRAVAIAPHGSIAITGATETNTSFDQAYYIPANSLKVGTIVRLRAQGIVTAATGTETHVFNVMFGSTSLAVTGNIDPAANDVWALEFEFIVRSTGATGTVIGQGVCRSGPRATAAPGTHLLATGATSTSTTTIDSTARTALTCSLDRQSSATDGDSLRMDTFYVEIVNP